MNLGKVLLSLELVGKQPRLISPRILREGREKDGADFQQRSKAAKLASSRRKDDR
jgi:hypothetical protein